MPELTVSMPAFNTGKYIKEAIDSVLNQQEIDLELIVVNDGSYDNTSEIVRSFKDKRLIFIENKRNMGIGYCHNLVIEKSNSPFISHIDSDDMVRPGALRKVVDALLQSPCAGQSHSYFFFIDEDGTTNRISFRDIRNHLTSYRKPDIDYKWNFLVHGSVMNHLRTYRKEIFKSIGKFDESIKYGIDYEMALRIIDKYEIKLVPEFLYCVRNHNSRTTSKIKFQNIKFWYQRFTTTRKLHSTKKINFVEESKHNLNRTALIGLYYVIGKSVHLDKINNKYSFIKHTLVYNFPETIKNSTYNLLTRYLSWWPLEIVRRVPHNDNKKVAYYIWRFPVLSQTFIRRELIALLKSGLTVEVIADEQGDFELNKTDSDLIKHITYLEPINKVNLSDYKNYFYRKNPIQYISLFIYVMSHKYGSYKNYKEDKSLFEKAIYLAGNLIDRNITHIHTPWSDKMAFIALIASRLLGIRYTVQARAHDIHRSTHKFGLKEKFNNADAVITNTIYNQRYIQSILNVPNKTRIHVIYEGINLKQFMPAKRNGFVTKPVRILSVARLIEEKGLIYLLKACRILKDKGISFSCEIVGGPEIPLYSSYLIQLKILHKKLKLEKHVLFLGYQPLRNVIKKYKESDIFVLPCVIAENGGRDTSPNSLIEAMAMKLPVITTNISGLTEIVDDGINGIIIEPMDEVQISEAIIRLINDHELRITLADNARKKIKDRFDINKNIHRYSQLFGFR